MEELNLRAFQNGIGGASWAEASRLLDFIASVPDSLGLEPEEVTLLKELEYRCNQVAIDNGLEVYTPCIFRD